MNRKVTIKVIAIIAAISIMLTGIFAAVSYAVGSPSDWAVAEINRAKELGLITNKVTADYQRDITREEFCELAVLLYEKTTLKTAAPAQNVFKDTNNERVLIAYNLGIVKGVSADRFAPNNPITRQEIAVMLVRTIHAALPDVVIPDSTRSNFVDNSSIADWAMSSVCFAAQQGIVNGVGENRFLPLTHATCEQAIALVLIATIQSTPHKTLIEEIMQSSVVEARYFVNGLLGIAEHTLAGIMTELSNNIVVFVTDKALVSALSRRRNIKPEDLEDGSDIYIQIPEHLLNQWPNLLGMMVNQFMRYFEQRDSQNAKPILFMLDEFPRLGKIDAIQNGLATLRGRGVNMCLVIQSLAQLDEIYGHDSRRSIADNCPYQAILSATDADTQELFSRLVGKWDKPKKGYGKNLELLQFVSNRSENISYERAYIIDPQEFRQLGNDAIVLTPFGYCRVEKMPYYLE